MKRNAKSQQSERTVSPRRFPFALLALGLLALLLPQVFSLAMFSSSSSSTGSIGAANDWTMPTVDLVDPGEAVRGTVVLTANAADARSGVKNVVFQRALSDTTTWTTMCTVLVAPYTCTWNTSGLAEDYYDLRVIATDNSDYTAEDLVEGVLVDNTAPTGALDPVPTPMSGVVTLTAQAADAGSGVASVTIQRAPTLTTNWTTICTDVDLPYSCRFDTTLVGDGFYDFREIVTDIAGNTLTTTVVNNTRNRQVVNTLVTTVSVEDPGAFLRGTVTVNANANATLGINNVKIQYQKSGTTTWVDLCTDTSAPYSCSWNTALVTDGQYSFRAIATPSVGTAVTSATVGPSTVDNTVVRGYDVQTVTGGSAGKLTANDQIVLTYSTTINPASIIAGWNGSARSAAVRLRDGLTFGLTTSDDIIDMLTAPSGGTVVNLGSVNLKANYIKNNKSAIFNATMTMTTVTVNGASASQIQIVLGTVASGGSLRTVSATTNMIWTPSALATNLTGSATSTAPVTELGTKDRDF